MRGIVIAGTHSGSGKTTVALGIMAALRKKGLTVQPFKTGPDFIDSGLHRLAAERTSRNLDLWMCGPDYVKRLFGRHSADADIAVIEGVMGLYDGDHSTAALGSLLGAPVVLVVDAYGMAESAGALVSGFAEYGVGGERLRLAGVVFNRVASEGHYRRLCKSVRSVPVLGYLSRDLAFEIPHRHLGLSTAEEDPIGKANLEKLADTVLRYVDIDQLVNSSVGREMSTSLQSEAQDSPAERMKTHPHPGPLPEGEGRRVRIAVAYDKAFCFYYEDNLDLIREAGAEILRFSPLADTEIPDADAVYFGGGYPELYADELSRNRTMRESVRSWAEAGKPVYAECGGLMYLSQGIRTDGSATHVMAGVFPFETKMLKGPRLGYRQAVLRKDCVVGRKGDVCRGHEFHYSEIVDRPEGTVYRLSDSRGAALPDEGFRYKNVLASYVHLHFGSNERIGRRFAEFIQGERSA